MATSISEIFRDRRKLVAQHIKLAWSRSDFLDRVSVSMMQIDCRKLLMESVTKFHLNLYVHVSLNQAARIERPSASRNLH